MAMVALKICPSEPPTGGNAVFTQRFSDKDTIRYLTRLGSLFLAINPEIISATQPPRLQALPWLMYGFIKASYVRD